MSIQKVDVYQMKWLIQVKSFDSRQKNSIKSSKKSFFFGFHVFHIVTLPAKTG